LTRVKYVVYTHTHTHTHLYCHMSHMLGMQIKSLAYTAPQKSNSSACHHQYYFTFEPNILYLHELYSWIFNVLSPSKYYLTRLKMLPFNFKFTL